MLSRWFLFYLLSCSTSVLQAAKPAKTDEIKITITSNKASCQQDKLHKKQFTFTYQDNVKIDFSDGTHAQSDKLIVDINTEKPQPSGAVSGKHDHVKKITLSHHVFFSQAERKAHADEAVFYPDKKQCMLSGNVRIIQKSTDQKAVPMNINCSKAAIDMVSGSIRLLGTDQKPVSTTLVLTKKPTLLQQPLVKTHAQHSAPLAKRST